jgi:hypothetical protein
VAKTASAAIASRYSRLIEKIFVDRYTPGATNIEFNREDIPDAATVLGIDLPKNLGDVVYSLRYRSAMPDAILQTQPQGKEWIIVGIGRSKYEFRLVTLNRILPRAELLPIGIPDSTPEIIRAYKLSDEQALLAVVRYNRLLDIFLGLTTYSLQSHLRTTVSHGSQIEIDELYVGLDRHGCHYVIPVQAKGGSDQISVVQTSQDLQWCAENFPGVRCRAISAQFMSEDRIAMFDLTVVGDEVKVVEERHYKLLPAADIDQKAIRDYKP